MRVAKPSYLLRFDDLCPTMSKERFERFMDIIERHEIRPILAVVPANQDPELKVDKADPAFWTRLRALESAGATIALHGYRHVCNSAGLSMVGKHSRTEFAGVSEGIQREWIHKGLETLRANGLTPRLFIAPRHGFDSATLRALLEEGLGCLSDGYASRAFRRGGVLWIPQQLWEPVKKSHGLWTICLHSNTAKLELFERLDAFLSENSKHFTSFDRVILHAEPTELRLHERIREALIMLRARSVRV